MLDCSLTGDTTKVIQVLFQKKSGAFLLVIWQEARCFNIDAKTDMVNADRALTLHLAVPVSAVHVYKPAPAPIGNGLTPVATYANISTVPLLVPDQVLVVELLTSTSANSPHALGGAPAASQTRKGGSGQTELYDLRGRKIIDSGMPALTLKITEGLIKWVWQRERP